MQDEAGNPLPDARVGVTIRPVGADANPAASADAGQSTPGQDEREALELAGAGPWRVSVRVSPKGERSRTAAWQVVMPGP